MPSSTSSFDFERRIPALPWRGITVIVVLIILAAAAAWEFHVRSIGYAPTLNDTEDLWTQARRAVQPESLVIVGESRPLFDLDLDELEKGLIGVSAKQVGILTTVEMLVAALCIIPASHFADKHSREPFILGTFVFFTLFPIALWISSSFLLLLLAFAIRGLKEFGDTSRKALIIGSCAPERRGQMIGAYYLVRDLLVSLAAILGAWLWKLGPSANFLGAAAFGACGTIYYIFTLRRPSAGRPARA